MNRDSDPTPPHGITRPGVAYIVARGPRFSRPWAARGKLVPGGDVWTDTNGGSWGPADRSTPRYFLTREAAQRIADWYGGWEVREVLTEIPA